MELFALIKQDDAFAFEELYSRYWDKLFGNAYKRLASKEQTEELIQDLFTNLWVNRNKILITSSLVGYLTTSVKYMVINQLQKQKVRKQYVEIVKPFTVKQSNSTEDTVAFNDLENKLAKEVEKLPEKCQAVFKMSRYEQQSVKDIARKLEISEKTVENHIGKALKVLKSNLKDFVSTILFLITTSW